MYELFFGLRDNPFSVSPDPQFLVPTERTDEALASLIYGILERRGFILLTGEVGTGKTTILNMFLEWLSKSSVENAFVFNPSLNAVEFLDFVMSDFGIPCNSNLKSQKLIRLNQWLLERYRANGTAVLIIDEAQNLSAEVLEEVRLLTNLETAQEKLLQIVLSGQPELENKLCQTELRQLRQRITLWCRTAALTKSEVEFYINERLRCAGRTSGEIFKPAAIDSIYQYSHGIQRVINLICDHALITAYAEGRQSISSDTIEAVAKEFRLNNGVALSVQAQGNGDLIGAQKKITLDALMTLIENLRRMHPGDEGIR
jgi:general secretion pathway protein A